jgi:hypothetical protein
MQAWILSLQAGLWLEPGKKNNPTEALRRVSRVRNYLGIGLGWLEVKSIRGSRFHRHAWLAGLIRPEAVST